MKKTNFAWALLLILFLPALTAVATPLPWTVPAGLSVGVSYQLIFVTSGTHTAVSKQLSDYDTFVNQEADGFHIGPNDFGVSGKPIKWHAIVSVLDPNGGTSNAKANAVQTAPVYNLEGELVATGGGFTAPLYGGPLSNSAVRWSPDGTQAARQVFSGSSFTGIASTFPAGNGGAVSIGNSTDIGTTWLGAGFGVTQPGTSSLSFYALSDAIQAPEPSVIGLMCCGLLILGRRRRSD